MAPAHRMAMSAFFQCFTLRANFVLVSEKQLSMLLVLRSVHPAIGHIVASARVTPRIPRSERATYLSLHSLAGRAGYGAVLLSLAALAGASEVVTAADLKILLGACTALAGVGLVALLATRTRAESAARPAGDTIGA